MEHMAESMKKKYLELEEQKTSSQGYFSEANIKKREKEHEELISECSEIALVYYNQANGLDFELVEVVEGILTVGRRRMDDGILRHGLWFHVNFKAKPKNDPSPKLFFAELLGHGSGKRVTLCCILEPSDPGNVIGCGFCNPKRELCHPANGFCAGQGPYRPRHCTSLYIGDPIPGIYH